MKHKLSCSIALLMSLAISQVSHASTMDAILALLRGSMSNINVQAQGDILNFALNNRLGLSDDEIFDAVWLLSPQANEFPQVTKKSEKKKENSQNWTMVLVHLLQDCEETPENIQAFTEALENLPDADINDALHINTPHDGMMIINLAGFAVWNNKRIFLELLLKKGPHLLYQQSQPFQAEQLAGINFIFLQPQTIWLTTSLSCAVHYRKLEHKATDLEVIEPYFDALWKLRKSGLRKILRLTQT